MAITNASIGVQVKKKPFIYLWDVQITLSSGNHQRIYEALAGEKLLMAKMWCNPPVAAKQFAFWKGDNVNTNQISHILVSNSMSQIATDGQAMDPTQPHIQILIGGAASIDLMAKWVAGAVEIYTMHFQIFFEE